MTLNDAAQKFNNFQRPVAYFHVNGSLLPGEQLIYTSIQVNMSTGMEASDCTLEVVGQYSRFEDGKLQMDTSLDKLVLGAKLEVFLGYGESKNAQSVFVGYISSQEIDIQGDRVAVIVTAMDCKQFMMSSYRSLQKKGITKYSEAVNDVLKNYTALYKSKQVEVSAEVLAPIEQHNQSDYDFVVSLAKRLNYLFYVVQDTVYFVSYKKFTDSLLTVEPGENLRRFRREVTLANQVKSVTVRNHNTEDASKPFEAKATAVTGVGGGKKAGADATKLITATMEKVVADGSVRSEAESKARAQALLDQMSMGFLTGTIELSGIPILFPGHMITLKGFNEDLNRDYFITKVVHHLDRDGFDTIVHIAGNKM
ncbi:hypothetical protein DW094_04260 [Ruminococcaceae bacterium AM07-15]|nr:hypothetical protein DW094_04260 [Ruminococcaceae bacterium AM07-15]